MNQQDKETVHFHAQRLYGIALQHPNKAEQRAATFSINQLLKVIGWNPLKKEKE